MQYTTTTTFESKLVPGLKYTLNKMSHGRRVQLNQALAPVRSKAAEIERERRPLLEEIDRASEAAKIEPCTCGKCKPGESTCTTPKPEPGTVERLIELKEQFDREVLPELDSIWLRWGVKVIDGLEIDGASATIDSLIDSAPEGLVNEVVEEIRRLAQMTTEEQLAFKSPTTGQAAQVEGQKEITNAPNASE